MKNKLLALGLLLAFAALSLPGNANHIIDCDDAGATPSDNDGLNAPGCGEPNWSDPTDWGRQIGATFPVGDDNLCPSGTQPPCPTTGTDAICTPLGGAIGMVTGALTPPVPAQVQAIAILAGTIVYEFVCPDGYILGSNQGDTIFGFTACERNGSDPDPVTSEPGTPSLQAQGGVCNMSAGWSGNPCAHATTNNPDGDSNGAFTDYDGACQNEPYSPRDVIPDSAVARDWFQFSMQDVDPTNNIGWTSQIFGNSCFDGTSLAVNTYTYVDNQWLYMEDEGHVTGFPSVAPGPNDSDVGSYKVAKITGALSATQKAVTCDTPAPWYQSNSAT